jgi:hypothetical protein
VVWWRLACLATIGLRLVTWLKALEMHNGQIGADRYAPYAIAEGVMTIITAALLVEVIRGITRRQHERYNRLLRNTDGMHD